MSDAMGWLTLAEADPGPLTEAAIEAAMKRLRDGDTEARAAERSRALSVQAWLEGLPAHAVRHVFVTTMASAMRHGAVVAPRTAHQSEGYLERICAMTPAQSDADSAHLVLRLAEAADG